MNALSTEHGFGPANARALYSAAASRSLDALAINDFAVPGFTLMQRAGEAAFAAFRRRWPRRSRIAVLCGPGNNGGDGFVVARLAARAGWAVQVFCLGDYDDAKGDAGKALAALREEGIKPASWHDFNPARFDAAVDGLFGTGLTRDVDGDAARCVQRLNDVAGPVLALDIPSGLHADTGQVLGECVRARLTVTFIVRKLGLYTAEAASRVGEVCFADLDLPFDVLDQCIPDAWQVAWSDLHPILGPRRPTANKGHAGRVLIIGGDQGFAGAARMAGEAALRIGAGLVSVATRSDHATVMPMARPELMAKGIETVADLDPLLANAQVIGIGPGLGTGAWGRSLLAHVLNTGVPLVIDADALNLIAAHASLRAATRARRGPVLLTPHPGEAARLLQSSVPQIESQRFASAAALSESLGAAVLLKGRGTLVHCPGQLPVVCVGGHAAMASGGMGDVLTGVLCGMLAQGMPLQAAAVRGATVHARAAEQISARDRLERGLLASSLMPTLTTLARWL